MEKHLLVFTTFAAVGINLATAQANSTIITSNNNASLSGSNVSTNVTSNPNQQVNVTVVIPGRQILTGMNSLGLGLGSLLGSGFSGGDNSFVGRCIGIGKKIRTLMPFLVFKLGVISTTLGFLTLFALKGLAIGVILLILNIAGFAGKLALFKGQHQEVHYSPPQPSVHVHLHKDEHGSYTVQDHHSSHGPTAWADRISQGLSSSKTLEERAELLNMYKRLGFNVNGMARSVGDEVNSASSTYFYPGTYNDSRVRNNRKTS